MIGSLYGKITTKSGETLIIDVGGVGYEVTVSSSVSALFPVSEKPVRLVIFTDVKENSISLYGFQDALEKEVFLLLRKVKGIGSKLALGILSATGPETLLQAIAQNDVTRLKKVPGIGSKTAERVIVELRETVTELTGGVLTQTLVAAAGTEGRGGFAGVEGDVILALEKLGFPPDRAQLMLKKTLEKNAAELERLKADPGELLRLSLGQMG